MVYQLKANKRFGVSETLLFSFHLSFPDMIRLKVLHSNIVTSPGITAQASGEIFGSVDYNYWKSDCKALMFSWLLLHCAAHGSQL